MIRKIAKTIGFVIYYLIGAFIMWWITGDIMHENAGFDSESAAIMVIFGWGPLAMIGLPLAMALLHQSMKLFTQREQLSDKLLFIGIMCASLLFSFSPYMVAEWYTTGLVPAIIAVMMFFWSLFGFLATKVSSLTTRITG